MWSAVAGAILAATVQGWRYDSRISATEAAADKARAVAADWVVGEMKRSAEVVAAADKEATKVITDARQETEQLRTCIDRGDGCGLRVKVAKCPKMPDTGTTPSVGDGSGEYAELDASSRRAYYTLRERIPILENALKVCVRATQ